MYQTYSKKVVGYVTFVISSLAVVMAFQMPQAQATRLNSTTEDFSLNLTTAGSAGFVNGAYFQQISNSNPAGTGVIDSFLRIDSNNRIQQGYNTDYRSVQFDEKTDKNFTHSLLLSAIPIVKINNIEYRQFILDINEPNSDKNNRNRQDITLDMLQIFLGNVGNLTKYPTFDGKATKIFDLDTTNRNNSVLLTDLNPGSGRYDLLTYIPNALFTGTNPYVYLYSRFTGNDGGYEEWAVLKPQESEQNKSDKNKSEDKKSEDKKSDDDKSNDKKSEDKKSEDKNKSEDKKSEDKKSDDDKSDEKKSDDDKSDDKKSDDDKSDEKKSDDKKSEDKKSDDDKSDEKKSESQKSDEKKSDDDKSDDDKYEQNKSNDKKSDDDKSEKIKSDDNKKPSTTTRPLPIISFNVNDIGKTFQFNFDGSVDEKNVSGLTSTAWFTLKSFTGTAADFDVALDNTSSKGITSRTSGLGFNVYTKLGSTEKLDFASTDKTTSGLFENAVLDGAFPNQFGDIDVCFTDGNTCQGGQDGGVKTNDGIKNFSFSLAFKKTVDSFALGNFGVRYQSIEGTKLGTSGTGQGTYYVKKPPVKKVPESGTSLGLGLFVIGTLKLLKKKPSA